MEGSFTRKFSIGLPLWAAWRVGALIQAWQWSKLALSTVSVGSHRRTTQIAIIKTLFS